MVNSQAVRAIVVDDSSLIRRCLTRDLGQEPGVEVVGSATDLRSAQELIQTLEPQVMVLDLELDNEDSVSFLRMTLGDSKLAVFGLSSSSESGAAAGIAALTAGAAEVFAKPSGNYSLSQLCKRLAVWIRATHSMHLPPTPFVMNEAPLEFDAATCNSKVIAIGGGTGSVLALESILSTFPEDGPAVVATLHLPAKFTTVLAQHLDHRCEMKVKEALDGDAVLPGTVLLNPGDHVMHVQPVGKQVRIALSSGSASGNHISTVDTLFETTSRTVRGNAMGILLSGMGNDGASGMKLMRDAGGFTVAQQEASCLLSEMPQHAVVHGGVTQTLAVEQIPERIVDFASLPDANATPTA